jgi:O-antigen ligase
MPTRDFLPVPRHATQEVVLWPWHLGHNVFVGISPPVLGIYLRCIAPAAVAMLAAMRRASSIAARANAARLLARYFLSNTFLVFGLTQCVRAQAVQVTGS